MHLSSLISQGATARTSCYQILNNLQFPTLGHVCSLTDTSMPSHRWFLFMTCSSLPPTVHLTLTFHHTIHTCSSVEPNLPYHTVRFSWGLTSSVICPFPSHQNHRILIHCTHPSGHWLFCIMITGSFVSLPHSVSSMRTKTVCFCHFSVSSTWHLLGTKLIRKWIYDWRIQYMKNA